MNRAGIDEVYEFIKRLKAKGINNRAKREDRKALERIISQRAINGKISCAECFRIADDFGFPKKELTKIINEMNIKISQCQLGCFE